MGLKSALNTKFFLAGLAGRALLLECDEHSDDLMAEFGIKPISYYLNTKANGLNIPFVAEVVDAAKRQQDGLDATNVERALKKIGWGQLLVAVVLYYADIYLDFTVMRDFVNDKHHIKAGLSATFALLAIAITCAFDLQSAGEDTHALKRRCCNCCRPQIQHGASTPRHWQPELEQSLGPADEDDAEAGVTECKYLTQVCVDAAVPGQPPLGVESAQDILPRWTYTAESRTTKILLNVTLTRMLAESWRALRFMRLGYSPPPGFDAARIAEGLFESVPQSLLQAYSAVEDMYAGNQVSNALMLSIFTSFVTLGLSVATLGRAAAPLWRLSFFLFAVVQAMLRTFTLSAVLVVIMRKSVLAYAGWQGKLIGCTLNGALCFCSVLVSVLAMRQRGHEMRDVRSWAFGAVRFMIPIDVDKFTALKGVEPEPPHVRFMLWRTLELISCAVFAIENIEFAAQSADFRVCGCQVNATCGNLTTYARPEAGILSFPSTASTMYYWLTCAILFTFLLWFAVLVTPYGKETMASPQVQRAFAPSPVR